MGFTKANPELFQAWANYPVARQHLVEFLDTMRRGLLDELRAVLVGPDAPPQAAADFATKGKSERGVVTQLGEVFVGFRVPAGGPNVSGSAYGAGSAASSTSTSMWSTW